MASRLKNPVYRRLIQITEDNVVAYKSFAGVSTSAIIQLFLHITTLLRAENCDVEAVSFAEMETCRTMLKLVTAIVRVSKNDPSRSKCCDDFLRALNGQDDETVDATSNEEHLGLNFDNDTLQSPITLSLTWLCSTNKHVDKKKKALRNLIAQEMVLMYSICISSSRNFHE